VAFKKVLVNSPFLPFFLSFFLTNESFALFIHL
jgi:hypothetical protein